MNKKLYKLLCTNYNKKLDKEMYEIYEETLREYQDYMVNDAIKYIIQHDKFMPTVARIIEVIKELPNREITEKEKRDQWEKKNIIPKWLDEYLTYEKLEPEEIEKLNKEMSIFE